MKKLFESGNRVMVASRTTNSSGYSGVVNIPDAVTFDGKKKKLEKFNIIYDYEK